MFAPTKVNLRQWTYKELASKATTRSPHTTDFRHMLPFPKAWGKSNTWADSSIKSVRAHLRVKYWNIVPGDKIGIRGEDSQTVHEVLSVSKINNKVFLKNTSTNSATGRPNLSQSVHYSRCQLFLRNYEFPKEDGTTETLPVFARRLVSHRPVWQSGRFHWDRVATNSVPAIPEFEHEVVPWPEPEEKPANPLPGAMDTLQESLEALTFVPPTVAKLPGPEAEHVYLSKIYNPNKAFSEASSEVQPLFLTKELSNIHSRAKKMARYTAYKKYETDLLKVYVDDELAHLDGRNVKDAKTEAQWKWREAILAEKKADKKRRWLNVARVEKIARKTEHKKEKEERQRRSLTNLVLTASKNQFIPPVDIEATKSRN